MDRWARKYSRKPMSCLCQRWQGQFKSEFEVHSNHDLFSQCFSCIGAPLQYIIESNMSIYTIEGSQVVICFYSNYQLSLRFTVQNTDLYFYPTVWSLGPKGLKHIHFPFCICHSYCDIKLKLCGCVSKCTCVSFLLMWKFVYSAIMHKETVISCMKYKETFYSLYHVLFGSWRLNPRLIDYYINHCAEVALKVITLYHFSARYKSGLLPSNQLHFLN